MEKRSWTAGMAVSFFWPFWGFLLFCLLYTRKEPEEINAGMNMLVWTLLGILFNATLLLLIVMYANQYDANLFRGDR